MPLPAIGWAIFELVVAAISAYEAYSVLQDLYDGFEKYNEGLDKAKEQVKETIERLKQEIAQKIDEKEEVAILLTLSSRDPQSPTTRKASGRGSGSDEINAAIEQKIPFRRAISKVCERADAMPVFTLKREKGVQVSDLPKAKRKILEALLAKGFEEITEADLGDFIAVRLKQLAASLVFEFIDDCLEWRSPLKTEVSFGPPPGYEDPPSEGTKLVRKGTINPFYPAPHRQKGSIAADLMIPDYRKEPSGKRNLFAIIEIKFPGDRIEREQFENYAELLNAAKGAKTKAASVRFDKLPVSSGGRLALFRWPEDQAAGSDDDEKKDKPGSGQNDKSDGHGSKPTKRRRPGL